MAKLRRKRTPQSPGLWGIFLLASCVFVTGCGVVASPKKGVGAWDFPHVDKAIAEINVSWFYTWQPHPMRITKPDRVEFVPMIWGETFVEPKQLELAKKSGSVLLGFNEPDLPDQANLTVKQALDLWPHLTATGMRLGSPATAADPSLSGSWLEQFMDGAKARGYRVDFVCVHWYGEKFDIDRAVRRLKNFLQVSSSFQSGSRNTVSFAGVTRPLILAGSSRQSSHRSPSRCSRHSHSWSGMRGSLCPRG